MRTRDPLDPLKPHEVPREPPTPWFWIIAALIAMIFVLWLLLSLANQPETGGVQGLGARDDGTKPASARSLSSARRARARRR